MITTSAIPANVHRARIEQVIAHMRTSLDAPMRLEEMAALAQLSAFYFDRVFMSLTGLSAGAFQAALRLEAAKRALLQSDGTVTEICFSLGYESLGSFTARFTRAVGISPSAFRTRVARLNGTDMCELLAGAIGERSTAMRSCDAAIRGSLAHAQSEDAIAWIGAFPKGIPDRPPSAGTIAMGNAAFGLGPLANGTYHVMAAAYPPSPRIADYLVRCESMRVARSGPWNVREAKKDALLLRLRHVEVTDPPILLALPLFSLSKMREAETLGV